MSHTELDLIIYIVTGLLAGVVSELGGAGALLSLPVLMSLGVPAVVANASNRPGVMTLYSFAYWEYRSHHPHVFPPAIYTIPLLIGVAVGASFASFISNAAMQWIVISVTIAMVMFTALGPDLRTTPPKRQYKVLTISLMLVIGAYSGFIEQAMAYLIFFALVRVLGVEVEQGRAMKIFLAMVITPVAMVVFIVFGKIDWAIAIPVALGSAAGGWIGAWLLEKLRTRAVRRAILISLVVSLVYLIIYLAKHYFYFNIWTW